MPNKMTYSEIVKTSGEIGCNKIKAIYPHIVVSGDIDKPCYSIQWYDIEKKTMFDGYASYKLGLVKKWLQEDFEVIDDDIGDFINRLQADKEALIAGQETLQKALAEKNAEIERLQESAKEAVSCFNRMESLYHIKCMEIKVTKSEAIKELAERLDEESFQIVENENTEIMAKRSVVYMRTVDEVKKEMVGEG